MDELVKALRCEYYGDDECDNSACPYWPELGCKNGVANRDAADAIEKLTGIKDKLILNICSHCDSHLAGCEDCPIIKEINEVFDDDNE